jgi:hypothetical protein
LLARRTRTGPARQYRDRRNRPHLRPIDRPTLAGANGVGRAEIDNQYKRRFDMIRSSSTR